MKKENETLREKTKRERDKWRTAVERVADEFKRIADNGQYVSEVEIWIRFDGGAISDSEVKAQGRAPKTAS